MKKTFLLIVLFAILGMYAGILLEHFFFHNDSEYFIQLLDYDGVQIMDQNHKLLKTTTTDSFGYYLEHDNI